MKKLQILFCIFLLFRLQIAFSQSFSIKGRITDSSQQPVEDAQIFIEGTSYKAFSDILGNYELKISDAGTYKIGVLKFGLKSASGLVTVSGATTTLDFVLMGIENAIDEVEIEGQKENTFGITRLKSVEGFTINESKKSEVIVMNDVVANTATNNARQIFAKVPGLNIWENDPAGLQLSIGARGLSPTRTSNFNLRQNGYDISADPIGYPESYYTPPTEALEKIEILRGAASLQYGPQFGGMINFQMKKGPKNKPFELISRQTGGSFGFFNSFNSIGGTKGKLNYYSFYQYKRGDGWRQNSAFEAHTGYANLNYKASEKLSIGGDFTAMHNLAQQPGGLNNFYFEQDPRQSRRARNWFKVQWLLAAVYADYKLSDKTKINTRFFFNNSARLSLGNLTRIDRNDDVSIPRTLIWDNFLNIGNETRLLHNYSIQGRKAVLLTGFRAFQGHTHSRQGDGNTASGPDFFYTNPNNLENSDYRFVNTNGSFFAENVLFINNRFSITPGFRYEYIRTEADGYYNLRVLDGAGNVVVQNKVFENRAYPRAGIFLAGLGTSFRPNEHLELYANFSQNYRAVTFSDIRIRNPNFKIDPNIKDERGYNADLGLRGNVKHYLNFDVSLFYMSYQDRIGNVLRSDAESQFIEYRYQTNISDSRTYGIEAFAELDFIKLFNPSSKNLSLSFFNNISINDSRYINSQDASVRNKRVETVPYLTWRTGFTSRYKNWAATLQSGYVSSQFADATNATSLNTNFGTGATGVIGEIPAYFVADFSVKYYWKYLIAEAGINNLTNTIYYTRRAASYPGPGILPSDPRNFYITLGVKF